MTILTLIPMDPDTGAQLVTLPADPVNHELSAALAAFNAKTGRNPVLDRETYTGPLRRKNRDAEARRLLGLS